MPYCQIENAECDRKAYDQCIQCDRWICDSCSVRDPKFEHLRICAWCWETMTESPKWRFADHCDRVTEALEQHGVALQLPLTLPEQDIAVVCEVKEHRHAA